MRFTLLWAAQTAARDIQALARPEMGGLDLRFSYLFQQWRDNEDSKDGLSRRCNMQLERSEIRASCGCSVRPLWESEVAEQSLSCSPCSPRATTIVKAILQARLCMGLDFLKYARVAACQLTGTTRRLGKECRSSA